MEEPLDIIVLGFDGDPSQAEQKLIESFGLDRARAQRLLRELPVLVKRRAGPETARRYVDALTAIGARVETRPSSSTPAGPGAAISTLPLPPTSVMARLRESVRVERETARAIRQFRASEGLSEDPPINLLNPAIPRAPALPRDLHKMPNAAAPSPGDAPAWVLEDPMAHGEAMLSSVPAPLEAQRPPPRSVHGEAPLSSLPPPRHSFIDSIRGELESGPTRSAELTGRPAPSGPPLRRPHGLTRLRHSRLALSGLLVAVTLLALWTAGVFPSEDRARVEAWRAAGIHPGEYAPAGLWLALADNRVEGLSQSEARALLERLARAGAKNAYVVQIERSIARGLLIELPRDPEARRTVFWHAATQKGGGSMLHMDTGQRFHVLEFR
jgi:hypothetical protein